MASDKEEYDGFASFATKDYGTKRQKPESWTTTAEIDSDAETVVNADNGTPIYTSEDDAGKGKKRRWTRAEIQRLIEVADYKDGIDYAKLTRDYNNGTGIKTRTEAEVRLKYQEIQNKQVSVVHEDSDGAITVGQLVDLTGDGAPLLMEQLHNHAVMRLKGRASIVLDDAEFADVFDDDRVEFAEKLMKIPPEKLLVALKAYKKKVLNTHHATFACDSIEQAIDLYLAELPKCKTAYDLKKLADWYPKQLQAIRENWILDLESDIPKLSKRMRDMKSVEQWLSISPIELWECALSRDIATEGKTIVVSNIMKAVRELHRKLTDSNRDRIMNEIPTETNDCQELKDYKKQLTKYANLTNN